MRRHHSGGQVHPSVGGTGRVTCWWSGHPGRPTTSTGRRRCPTTTPGFYVIPPVRCDLGRPRPGRAEKRPRLQRGLAAGGGALQRGARRRRAGRVAVAAQRRQRPRGTARRHPLRAGRHQQLLQAGELSRPRGSWSERRFDGLDPFNTSQNGAESNWGAQGSDAGRYDDSDIWAVRMVGARAQHPPQLRTQQRAHFENFANERHRILGEIPLRKVDDEGKTRFSIPKAIQTPASWPRSRPTRPSLSRPSTATAWCSTWRRPGTRSGRARCAPTAAAATPTASSRSRSRGPPRRARTT